MTTKQPRFITDHNQHFCIGSINTFKIYGLWVTSKYDEKKKYYDYAVTLTGAEPAAPAAPVAVSQQYCSNLAAVSQQYHSSLTAVLQQYCSSIAAVSQHFQFLGPTENVPIF